MATVFARQLREIAAKSTNELDLRERRNAYAESLIFERSVAVKQDWETLYQLCHEGFQELCLLDGRFKDFERNLFGYQSKDQDREQLSKPQNEALDDVIEQCLEVLGSRLILRPGIKALEWLVRRFRVHVYNTSALLLTLLPFHEDNLFQNALSIVPASQIVDEWKFLRPYHQNASRVPRHSIVYTATTNDAFFSALNRYAVGACQMGSSNPIFMRFWSSVVLEAVAARLKQAQSGRKEVQKQRSEDIFLKVLPVINDGLELESNSDMTITCFALTLIIANTGLLGDTAIDSLMQAIASTLSDPAMDVNQALVCLSILSTQKEEPTVLVRVINMIAKLNDPVSQLQNVRRQYPIFNLLQGLVRGSLVAVKQKDVAPRVAFLHKLFKAGPSLCEEADLLRLLAIVVYYLQQNNQPKISVSASAMSAKVKSLLQDLYESGDFTDLFFRLRTLCQENGVKLDGLLEAPIPEIEFSEQSAEDMNMDTQPETEEIIQSKVAALPSPNQTHETFLVAEASPIFDRLYQVFGLCMGVEDGQTRFSDLLYWKNCHSSVPYITFLLKIASGHYQAQTRTAAVALLTKWVNHKSGLNSQALLPYVSILLADVSPGVRRGAASLVLAMETSCRADASSNAEHDIIELLNDNNAPAYPVLSTDMLGKILRQVYLPSIEECVSDSKQIYVVLKQALNGSVTQHQSSSKQPNIEIKKSLRHGLFECIASHAVATPLLRVKMAIIRLLAGVGKIGSTTRNDALNQILLDWLSFTAEEAGGKAQVEDLELSAVDETFAQLVTAHDRGTFYQIVKAVEEQSLSVRPGLIAALYEQFASTWTSLKEEGQRRLAITLFNLAFSQDAILARGARATLRKVSLPAAALQALLQHSLNGAQASAIESSPSKKRKLNDGNRASSPDQVPACSSHDIPRVVFALELADGSVVESRPELMPILFDALILLRRLKATLQSELPYALGLCLNNLLAIVDFARRSRHPGLDLSSIRADVVIECVRNADSPQVQSDALLLSASLAELAPDRVIHHVMPVFTFVGNTMLSLTDVHSVNVINQAIDHIIPPLVGKLKQQDEKNLITSTAGLLSSFVAAFNHIPHNRRVGLYQRLLQRLGPEDFGFALLAMLATSKSASGSRDDFLVIMMSGFPPMEQLINYAKVIDLIRDIYADKPHDAESLLHIDSSSSPAERLEMALRLFKLATNLLRSRPLRWELSKIRTSGKDGAGLVQEELKRCLHQVLETIRVHKPYGTDMTSAARKCMGALLELFSLSQLIATLPTLLDEMEQGDENLKPEALNVLAAQMQGKVPTDQNTASAALGYMSSLEEVIKTSESTELKEAALACIDRIIEKYGRKDLDAVVKTSTVLAGEAGLAAPQAAVQHRSALTLSSMFDIMGEAGVPVVSPAMENALALIRNSFEEDRENAQIHGAGFTLISAIVSNIPFMICEDHLDRTLELAADAAFSNLPSSCIDTRRDTLSHIARKLDLDNLVSSLSRTWERIVENDIDAVLPCVDMCVEAIEHHSKSAVIKSADSISSFILHVLDLRRIQFTTHNEESYSDEEVAQVESKANALALKFIYKLNDAVFRPIFERWLEWAVQCHDLPSDTALQRSRLLRQISVFTFLAHFFSDLKSLVTSYAAYIIVPANTILSTFATNMTPDLTEPDSLLLYTTLLSLLRSVFLHDADNFFTTPSHFQPLTTNLLAQLRLASQKPFRPLMQSHVIPAIVAFAMAVQDTPGHHLVMNHELAQLRHVESASVRLAGVDTHIAITQEEEGGVGEEWVNNVVAGTISAATGVDDGDGSKGKAVAAVGGSGETMIYVNEMLEDDDENVEKAVRRWVGMVRDKMGEDVFEF